MPRPHGSGSNERKVMGAVSAAARMAQRAKKAPSGMDAKSAGAAVYKQIKVTKGLAIPDLRKPSISVGL